MRKGTRAKTTAPQETADSLAELFGGSDDDSRVDFDDIDWLAFGRLVALATRRGAFVGVYIASDDNTLCFSIGVGDKRKRYSADNGEQFDIIAAAVATKLGVPRLLPSEPKPTK